MGQAVDSRQTSEQNIPLCNGINVLPMNNRTGHLFLFIVVVQKSKVFESCSGTFDIKIRRKVNTLKDFVVTFQKLFTTTNSSLLSAEFKYDLGQGRRFSDTRAIGGTMRDVFVTVLKKNYKLKLLKIMNLDKLSFITFDWLETGEVEMQFIEFQCSSISAPYLFKIYIRGFRN